MPSLFLFSDTELLARMAAVVQAERKASVDVVEHLMEVKRRRLYLDQACSSLYTYCRERLGYTEDAALKRARIARLALRLPRVLDDLRSGAIHLTGLFLLDRYLNSENAEALLAEARGKSRRELEKILAIRFPRPDVPSNIEPLGTTPTLPLGAEASGARLSSSGPSPWFTCPGTGTATSTAHGGETDRDSRSRVEPLSAERYRVEFTASAALRAKIEQARQLVSHALPDGDLAQLFERALDELIARELKRRVGAGKPRGSAKLRAGSRHVPLAVAKQVWERDGNQCTFVDAAGRRCQERRFLTLEHRHLFSLGGPATVENLCLFCKAHTAHTARRVFGETFIASRIVAREDRVTRLDDVDIDIASSQASVQQSPAHTDAFAKVRSALTHMGFCKRTVASALTLLHREQPDFELEPLLRAALNLLTPPPS
jgi:hypothetical protein